MNNSENSYLFETLMWLNKQNSESIKSAMEKWSDDYKTIADMAYWFDQITNAVTANPPTDNVRSLVVKENVFGIVVGVGYEYYQKNDPRIGKIGICITTVNEKRNKLNK